MQQHVSIMRENQAHCRQELGLADASALQARTLLQEVERLATAATAVGSALASPHCEGCTPAFPRGFKVLRSALVTTPLFAAQALVFGMFMKAPGLFRRQRSYDGER
eukprot:2507633-Amphidinium_carterae.1